MGVGGHSTPQPLYPRVKPDTHGIGVLVNIGVGLDSAEYLAPTGVRSPARPVRS
jgi:hypothetical protein